MLQEYTYYIEHGELVIQKTDNKAITWRGRPKGTDVDAVFAIPNTGDCIVLLNWNQGTQGNIIRVGINGEILWEARCPGKAMYGVNRLNDVYVGIHKVESEKIYANSWCGFLDTINLNNGEIIESSFVK